ncbi:MAG: protein kinase [Planctomycetaceae bacterium]
MNLPDSTRFPGTEADGQDAFATLHTGEAAANSGVDPIYVRYFGDYELISEIARGGMGVVYKARQVNLNRIVALKMILTGSLATETDIQRFRAEAEAAAKLDHPGIVPIFEIGQHEGQHYFSMGYIEGQSLWQLTKEGPLIPTVAAQLTRRIAEAIAYAHEKGVIHRDLKPANVLVDSTGEPRVTDFGLARRMESDSGLTKTGSVIGTPSYMPPEQAAGRMHEVGILSDVYSIGAILYCLLSGRPPFQAATPAETMRQVLDQEPVSVAILNPEVPRDLETICHKCLQKDPANRYVSANALASDLGRWIRGEPVLARPPGIYYRLSKFARKHKWGLLAALATALALVIATIVSVRFAFKAQAALEVSEGDKRRALIAERVAQEESQEATKSRIRAESEKEQAERARRVSEVVREFLADSLLQQSSASHQALYLSRFGSTARVQHDVTVRELLDRAAVEFSPARIAERFPDDSDAQCEILGTIADAYLACALYDRAIEYATAVRDLRLAEYGDSSPEGAADTVTLASILVAASRTSDAVSEGRRVVQLIDQELERSVVQKQTQSGDFENSPHTPILDAVIDRLIERVDPLRYSFPTIKFELYDSTAAVFILLQEIGRLENIRQNAGKLFGPSDRRALVTEMFTGLCYNAVGRLEKAVEIYDRVLANGRNSNFDELLVASVRTVLAQCCADLEIRSEEGLEASRYFHEVISRRAGPQHPMTLQSQMNMAIDLSDAGRNLHALCLLDSVFEMQETILGVAHPDTIFTLVWQARVYKDLLEPAAALECLEEAESRLLKSPQPDGPVLLEVRSELASLLRHSDPDRSILLYQQVVAQQDLIRGPNHPQSLTETARLAWTLKQAGRNIEALPVFERAIEGESKRRGKVHPVVLVMRWGYGTTLRNSGRKQDAATEIQFVLTHLKNTVADGDLTALRKELYKELLKQGRDEDVWSLVREDYARLQTTLAKRPDELSRRLTNMAEDLLNTETPRAALVAEVVLEESRKLASPDSVPRFRADYELARALIAQHRLPEAEHFLLQSLNGYRTQKHHLPRKELESVENRIRTQLSRVIWSSDLPM